MTEKVQHTIIISIYTKFITTYVYNFSDMSTLIKWRFSGIYSKCVKNYLVHNFEHFIKVVFLFVIFIYFLLLNFIF